MSWKSELRENITQIKALPSTLNFSEVERKEMEKIARVFPISTTPYYLSLIKSDDPDDPIRKMVLPTVSEADVEGDFDTSGEADNTVLPGVQHKYKKTVLILSTNQCAMYCRHCFRKRLVGVQTDETLSFLDNAVAYISEHPEVNNVLVSGGDSFLLDTSVIERYIERILAIPHVDFIRFGTRVPVVFPNRIFEDQALLEVLSKNRGDKQIYVVTQFNHPRELTPIALKGIRALQAAGVIVSNQTVLLKGVNDSPKVLAKLQNKLARYGVIPYYIFQCRPVKGVLNQFQVPIKQGVRIVEEAKKLMNGHSKRVRYCMSHVTGKIEILGQFEGEVMFKYHQAKKESNAGRIFAKDLADTQCWFKS